MMTDHAEVFSAEKDEDHKSTTLALLPSESSKHVGHDPPEYGKLHVDVGKVKGSIQEAQDDVQQQMRTTSEGGVFRPNSMQPYEQFRRALQVYHNFSDNADIRALNLQGDALWKDVMRLAKEAETKYLQKGEKGLRKMGRGISNNAEVALPYLKYFNPNLEYVSILFGGLRLVFEASAKIGEKRMKVLDALVQIPEAILQAERGVQLFPHDEKVRGCAENLYFMALAAIEGTIGWLEQGPIKKHFQALRLGPIYDRDFKEKIKALEQACKAVKRQVTYLCSSSVVRIEEKVGVIETSVQTIATTGETISKMNQRTIHEVNSIRADLERSNDQSNFRWGSVSEDVKILTQSAQETKANIENIANLTQVKGDLDKIWDKFLEQITDNAKWRERTHEGLEVWKSKQNQDMEAFRHSQNKEIEILKSKQREMRRLKKQVMEMQQAFIKLTPKELLDILDIGTEMPKQDLQRILKASTVLTDSPLAMNLLGSTAFMTWYHPDKSTQWFVEGGADARTSLRHTPLSLMCSKLIEGMQNKEPAVPIYFFCGSHTSQQDPARGPIGMIKSLIGQILQMYPVQLNFIPSQRYRVQLEAENIETLCNCFSELVKQLPMTTILLCIIDGISYFEAREFADECRQVVEELQMLVNNEDLDPRIKLLVTCPLRSKGIATLFPPDCRSSLCEDPMEMRSNLTEREIALANRRRIQPPEQELSQSLQRIPPPGSWSDESSDDEHESDTEDQSTIWT